MLVLDVHIHRQASKNQSYQESITTLFTAIAQFFDEQGFGSNSFAAKFESDPLYFRIESGDLSSDGMRWVQEHLHAWMGRMDRRRSRKSLEDLLESLRDTLR